MSKPNNDGKIGSGASNKQPGPTLFSGPVPVAVKTPGPYVFSEIDGL